MDTPQPTPSRARTRPDRRLLTLRELLEAVHGARSGTRLERVCWELNVDERWVRPAWDLAARIWLLERQGIDPLTGETMYALTARGRRALDELRRHRT